MVLPRRAGVDVIAVVAILDRSPSHIAMTFCMIAEKGALRAVVKRDDNLRASAVDSFSVPSLAVAHCGNFGLIGACHSARFTIERHNVCVRREYPRLTRSRRKRCLSGVLYIYAPM